MKKYISLALVFVVVLLVTAMIIRGSNDSEGGYDEFVQPMEHKDSPVADNFVGQRLLGLEIPRYDFEVVEQIMVKRGFTVSFNPNTKLPNWVAYELTDEETDGPWTRKGLRFMPDPDCKSRQADNNDYRNSGYSRGHLAPAGDMKWDEQAMNETFYLTNVCPQDAALNAGMWNDIEIKVREWARRDKSLIVVTGPIMGKNQETIGQDIDIAVPEAFFKVILSPNTTPKKAIAFICPNRSCGGTMQSYAVSVDEVEKRTGMNFFNALPDEIENRIEATCNLNQWLNR